MLTIECPNCKRVLSRPDDAGDLRVVCPNCGVAFAVVLESGTVRVVSTSIANEVAPDKPMSGIEEAEPPVWLPPINSSVYEDEGAKRTRRIHTWFVVGLLGCITFFGYQILNDRSLSPDGPEFFAVLLAVAIGSCLIGGGFGLVVGNLISYKSESYRQGEAALNRMWKALSNLAPRSRDDRPSPPPPATDRPSENVRPFDPPE